MGVPREDRIGERASAAASDTARLAGGARAGRRTAAPWRAQGQPLSLRFKGTPAPGQLPQARCNGVARRTARPRHSHHLTPADRPRFACRPQSSRALVHDTRQSLVFLPDARDTCHGLALCDFTLRKLFLHSPLRISGRRTAYLDTLCAPAAARAPAAPALNEAGEDSSR